MINTIVERFDGVDLIRPSGAFMWPCSQFEGFPECCGPGENGGTFERLVPEKVIGLVVSPACFIHDVMWSVKDKSWGAFHASNSVLLTNLLEINKKKGGYGLVQMARIPLIVAGFIAATSPVGAARYWAKSQEGR